MSVKFIFPPFAEHSISGPFLAPFLLASILKKEGIAAEAIDLNIRFLRKITESAVIKNILSESKFTLLETEVINHFISVPVSDYIKFSTDGLVHVLQILKKYFQTEIPDFDSCLYSDCKVTELKKNIYKDLIQELEIKENDIIGFSIPFAEQFYEAILLSNEIRKLHPEVKIISGGSQINLLNTLQLEKLKNSGIFHVIVKGDGVSGVVNLIRNISDNKESTVLHLPSVNQKQLNEIPYTVFNSTEKYFGRLVLPVLVTKGCYWGKCSFCDYIKLSDIESKNYLVRKPETVLEEIRELQKEYFNALIFLISDAVPPVWYKNLCLLAIKKEIKLRTWSYLMHSDFYDRDFFNLLSIAGVSAITFGSESTDNRLLNVLQKNFTKEIIFKNLHDAADFDFSITLNIIPDIPSATFSESIYVLKEIKLFSSLFNTLNVQNFVLTSDTFMARNPEKFDIQLINTDSYRSVHGFQSLSYIELNGMTVEEKSITHHAYREFALKMKIQKRIQSVMKNQIQDDTILFFDPSFFITDEISPVIFIVSLNLEYPAESWEADFFRNIISVHNRKPSFSELRDLFCYHSHMEVKLFLKYFLSLLKKGFVLKAN